MNQCLAALNVQLGIAHVIEIAIRSLQSVDERMPRRLIAVPGVVGPQSPAQGVFGLDATHGLIHDRQHV
jgi:hypothetical protein